jgi:hypothetical protein
MWHLDVVDVVVVDVVVLVVVVDVVVLVVVVDVVVEGDVKVLKMTPVSLSLPSFLLKVS